MPAFRRKHNPDTISDKVEGPLPLKLVRLCLRELYGFLDTVSDTVGGVPGSGSGGGGYAIATRVYLTWCMNGPYRVGTACDGGHVMQQAATITKVSLYRTVAGTSSSTILDIHYVRSGVDASLYTTQANRPTIAFGDTDKMVNCTLPDVTALLVDDIVYVDTDQVEGGLPLDWRLVVEAA